jgi:flagellar motility protein MotE (MotC chaperone)
MNAFRTLTRPRQGKALVGVLLFVAGIAMGAGAILGMRVGGVDPLAKVLPSATAKEKESVAKAEPEDPLKLKEVEVRRLLADAKSMRARMDQDSAEVALEKRRLEQERSALENLKREIDETGNRLTAEINTLRIEKDQAELKNTKRLAKIWGLMEPGEVFTIAKELDPNLVAQILYNMNERQAAPVIAGFSGSGLEGAKLASDVMTRLQELRLTTKTEPKNEGSNKGATR